MGKAAIQEVAAPYPKPQQEDGALVRKVQRLALLVKVKDAQISEIRGRLAAYEPVV